MTSKGVTLHKPCFDITKLGSFLGLVNCNTPGVFVRINYYSNRKTVLRLYIEETFVLRKVE